MGPTGGHTTGFSPNAARTALDEVLFSVSDIQGQPDELSIGDSLFFRQGTIDRYSFIWEEWSGVGLFDEHSEQEQRKKTNVRTGNKTTVEVRKWMKNVPISSEMNEDDIHGTVSETVREIGDSMFRTRTETGILDTYGDAFDGNVYTAPDGSALASNTHTMLDGSTLDNLETGTLNPDNLEATVKSLRLQKGHDGERAGHNFDGLLVPVNKYFDALEIMGAPQAPLQAFSAENQQNVFHTKYGNVSVKTSGYLDSDFNSGSNANTAYHAISRDHGIMRKVHNAGISTDMVEPKYSETDSWEYIARYREVSFPSRSGIGSVHNTGA